MFTKRSIAHPQTRCRSRGCERALFPLLIPLVPLIAPAQENLQEAVSPVLLCARHSAHCDGRQIFCFSRDANACLMLQLLYTQWEIPVFRVDDGQNTWKLERIERTIKQMKVEVQMCSDFNIVLLWNFLWRVLKLLSTNIVWNCIACASIYHKILEFRYC